MAAPPDAATGCTHIDDEPELPDSVVARFAIGFCFGSLPFLQLIAVLMSPSFNKVPVFRMLQMLRPDVLAL
jgi:hypothetical protein